MRFRTALVLAAFVLFGCKKETKDAPRRDTREPECATALDCGPAEACNQVECFAGECRRNFLPKGESCDNGDVCDGVSTCDGAGRCVAGAAPVIDDGNACTTDACDPRTGVTHQPVSVDDSDACTVDACDPRTGEVSHGAVDIDDGDDCTFDSCDPSKGPVHERKDATYTCSSCAQGFHAASKRPNAQCEGLQTFCAPDCGASFYSCSGCPKGYRAGATTTNPQCGSREATQTFCLRE